MIKTHFAENIKDQFITKTVYFMIIIHFLHFYLERIFIAVYAFNTKLKKEECYHRNIHEWLTA